MRATRHVARERPPLTRMECACMEVAAWRGPAAGTAWWIARLGECGAMGTCGGGGVLETGSKCLRGGMVADRQQGGSEMV